MELSNEARLMIGLMILSVPTIEFGGYFLLSQMGRGTIIKNELQRAYFRAGHAHAGVLVILGLIGQLVIDSSSLTGALEWAVRIGLVAAPILVSAGFFGGAPSEGEKPKALIRLVPTGAVILAVSLVALGLALLFV